MSGEVVIMKRTKTKITKQTTHLSMKKVRVLSQKWHKKLAGYTFSDSAKLTREDRDR